MSKICWDSTRAAEKILFPGNKKERFLKIKLGGVAGVLRSLP
jgi:hypothetical protein